MHLNFSKLLDSILDLLLHGPQRGMGATTPVVTRYTHSSDAIAKYYFQCQTDATRKNSSEDRLKKNK